MKTKHSVEFRVFIGLFSAIMLIGAGARETAIADENIGFIGFGSVYSAFSCADAHNKNHKDLLKRAEERCSNPPLEGLVSETYHPSGCKLLRPTNNSSTLHGIRQPPMPRKYSVDGTLSCICKGHSVVIEMD